MEKEKQLLLLCRKQIEQALKWGDSEAWTNDDFEHLSQKIFDKTRVQLSISTLKRIWGKVRYENSPTTGTLNALAGFLGYETWREFRQKNELAGNNEVIPLSPPPANTQETVPISKRKTPKTTTLIITSFGLILILAFIFFVGRKTPVFVDLSKVKFSATKVSDTLPNSVVFNYDASAFHSDSVYIQQSWDPTRREKVDGNGKQHTSIYYNPGYFIAKLIVNNRIKKECVVNIQTKGWKGVIEQKPIPIYLSEKQIKNKGFMGITAQLLQQKIGSPVFNNVTTKFANVRDFTSFDPANFTFETTLRNSSAVETSVCRRVNIVILLKGSAIIVPLANKGCISDISILSGYAYINGKDRDLSAFGCDFTQFQHVKLIVAGKRLNIWLNNKLIMNMPDTYTKGGIAGIRFEFEGAGEVKDLKLSSPNTVPYEEHF